jgi:hypothetical protein
LVVAALLAMVLPPVHVFNTARAFSSADLTQLDPFTPHRELTLHQIAVKRQLINMF